VQSELNRRSLGPGLVPLLFVLTRHPGGLAHCQVHALACGVVTIINTVV